MKLSAQRLDGQSYRLRTLNALLSPTREGPQAETTRSVWFPTHV
jgi:hypothetical protein